MSGYMWAKTPKGDLFVVLVVDGKGYVPGVGNAIELDTIDLLEPVRWPTAITQQSPSLPPTRRGALAHGAVAGSNILPFAASA